MKTNFVIMSCLTAGVVCAVAQNARYEFTLPMSGSGKLPGLTAVQPAATNAAVITNILDTFPYTIPFAEEIGNKTD
jgi:hypothetical protein